MAPSCSRPRVASRADRVSESVIGRFRAALSTRTVQAIVVIGLALAIVFVLGQPPRFQHAVGTLGECSFGSPIVAFDAATWERLAPADDRGYSAYEIPVLEWPMGTQFDHDAGVLLDEGGAAAFRMGDRVQVSGTVVDMRAGDIPPCFSAFGVRLEQIVVPYPQGDS